jgi:uncharacterized protein (DUF2237 family)
MLVFLYSRHYDKDEGSGCGSDCLKSRLCSTAVSQVGDHTQCDILLQEFLNQTKSEQVHYQITNQLLTEFPVSS